MSSLLLKILEFIPIIAFFIVYKLYNLITATLVMLFCMIAHNVIVYFKTKKINKMNLISLLLVLCSFVFTYFTGNVSYIKMKPTILYTIFSTIFIITTYCTKKTAIEYSLEENFHLEKSKWKILNLRFAFFFLGMGILNEIIWRNFSEAHWVKFKVFFSLPITILFVFLQTPFLIRNKKE